MRSPPLSLKGRALRYLAAREHSRAELERKLAPHVGADADGEAESGLSDLARVLDELTAKGFISEVRVAESVLHRRAARLGSARVLQELRAKGLPGAVVQDAAEQLRATELYRARQVWRAKFGTLPADAAGRAKQMRFLASRGFAGDVIRRALAAEAAGEPLDDEVKSSAPE
ncbi:recombination regulator RecX [Ottowia sp.]|uniref:recombination regulator RecX n=1 Tax=Ottowia sp. TaxID=1898956 RepID=UPI003A8852FE